MSILYSKEKLKALAEQYASLHDTRVARLLGFGTQGMVFETERNTAVKVHGNIHGYERERDVYIRLESRDIRSIRGLNIPRLRQYSDDLRLLEISIVQPPYLLDFGGAYCDDVPAHVNLNAEYEETAEQFDDKWEDVMAVLRELSFVADVIIVDVNPGNINFGGTKSLG